jgi:hypothetical protein
MSEGGRDSIEERVSRLEREARLWKRATFATFVLGAIVVFSSTVRIDSVRASGYQWLNVRGLTVVDEEGNARIVLSVDKQGPDVLLADEHRTPLADLGAIKGGPGLSLYDRLGQVRALLVNLDQKGPALSLVDEHGKDSVTLMTGDAGPSLNVYDKSGAVRAVFGGESLINPSTGATENTGPSAITLFGTDGKRIWRAP